MQESAEIKIILKKLYTLRACVGPLLEVLEVYGLSALLYNASLVDMSVPFSGCTLKLEKGSLASALSPGLCFQLCEVQLGLVTKILAA